MAGTAAALAAQGRVQDDEAQVDGVGLRAKVAHETWPTGRLSPSVAVTHQAIYRLGIAGLPVSIR